MIARTLGRKRGSEEDAGVNDKLGENPEIMAGVAMSIAREHAALRDKAERGEEQATKGTLVTAIVVIAVLIGTLVLMLLMNSAGTAT